ncbi:hypothetical protein SAMN05444273_1161 [Litoreibacter ascidiaceicola]|uniref:Uncharacterized protein n=1 Tax=Litoreibacter ascidiaceicola TaxID=1486859 RepID=A0A1M5EWC3_9RHOB|nr:hypothetical protein SAMN05444273_1161 [Litoreibacter ascidiaceicola]
MSKNLELMCQVTLLPDISCISRRTSCDSRRTAQEEVGWDGRIPCPPLTLITFSPGVTELGQFLGHFGATRGC